MKSLSPRIARYLTLAICVTLAGVFIYAGLDKIRDPLSFADSVAAFGLLPIILVTPFALGLPVLEVLCGLMLMVAPSRRVAAFTVVLLTAMFFIALAAALAQGLTLDCGCFGTGAPSRSRMWLESVLDVVLLIAALFVYINTASTVMGRTTEDDVSV